MKIQQFSCREENAIDLRQSNALIKHKPDVVFWEAPSNKDFATLVFNPNDTFKKQESVIKDIIDNLKHISKNNKWVLSDIKTYENTIKLLKGGHKIKMYNIDGPSELLTQTIINKWNLIEKPRHKGRNILWWVYIYLRERIMANNIKPLIKGDNQMVLSFMQKFHWIHVKFLLSNPTKDEIWKYYFGEFKNIKKSNIVEILKTRNKILYKYWLKYSDFV
jgi:hypothetical protein